jgi:ferric iron reductase protein FhuF
VSFHDRGYRGIVPDPLAPIVHTLATVRARQGEERTAGLVPTLLVDSTTRQEDWFPATRCADGSALPGLLDAAVRRWCAAPHVAAALLWKQYTYWLLLPAVLGYALDRRVPLMSAGNVLVRRHPGPSFVRLGLAEPATLDAPDAAALRPGLLDEHLGPMLDRLRELVPISRRTLLGSVASAVCYALVRARAELPRDRDIAGTAAELLSALGVADLVELTPDLAVRRRTCCLAFTLPQPKICAGCCIRFT